MQSYMPDTTRVLNHLKASPRSCATSSLRQTPAVSAGAWHPHGLKEAYNASVTAVKRFADAHIRIATLYIVSQARRSHSVRDHEDGEPPFRERARAARPGPVPQRALDKTAQQS